MPKSPASPENRFSCPTEGCDGLTMIHDIRKVVGGRYRRYRCRKCGARFSTLEQVAQSAKYKRRGLETLAEHQRKREFADQLLEKMRAEIYKWAEE